MRAAESHSHARVASRRSRLESRSALSVIRKSDPNQASRFELRDQLIHSGRGLFPADIVLVEQHADDLAEGAPGLDQIPDAGIDIRQSVIHAVAQAEDHDFVADRVDNWSALTTATASEGSGSVTGAVYPTAHPE
jgi:hypothetical protein